MDWHRRYLQQATWTRDLRAYLLEKAGLPSARRLLEVGCGTGAIISEMRAKGSEVSALGNRFTGMACGIDIDRHALAQCRANAPEAVIACANGFSLPFADGVFDIVCSHFFLLWVRDPLAALLEMKRVALKHGQILAFAEPDYTLRIDEPSELAAAGQLQTRSLQLQGADVGIGSRLRDLFGEAGIQINEAGEIKAPPPQPFDEGAAIDEWLVMRLDLEHVLSSGELDKMQELDAAARHRGTRRIHIPTSFAWGQV